jgi:hypothetical protein
MPALGREPFSKTRAKKFPRPRNPTDDELIRDIKDIQRGALLKQVDIGGRGEQVLKPRRQTQILGRLANRIGRGQPHVTPKTTEKEGITEINE